MEKGYSQSTSGRSPSRSYRKPYKWHNQQQYLNGKNRKNQRFNDWGVNSLITMKGEDEVSRRMTIEKQKAEEEKKKREEERQKEEEIKKDRGRSAEETSGRSAERKGKKDTNGADRGGREGEKTKRKGRTGESGSAIENTN